jgi:di/tripeptidase
MAITNGYTTLSEVKAILRITDNVDDTLLETCVESASRQIDTHCERVFTYGTATRVYTPRDSYVTEIDDLISLTTLKTSSAADGVFDITWTATDYQLEPLNGLSGGLYSPYTVIRAVGDYLYTTTGEEATTQVTGVFGYGTAVPTDVKQACNLLAIRQFKRYDSPLGVAGFGDIGVVRVSRLDPDVESLLSPYRKVRFA